MEAQVPQNGAEPSGQYDVSAPALIAAICDRLADLTTKGPMQASYAVAMDQLIACGGGREAAVAKLQHLRKRLFCHQPHPDPETVRDIALLDAAIGELTAG